MTEAPPTPSIETMTQVIEERAHEVDLVKVVKALTIATNRSLLYLADLALATATAVEALPDGYENSMKQVVKALDFIFLGALYEVLTGGNDV